MLDADARDRVIIALDCDRDRALELGHALAGKASWIKIGMTLYYAEGPAIVEEFKSLGFKVFLDLKFYDIPHQVEGAARSAALAGADLLSVHGSGASTMLRACREGAEQAATVRGDRPRLVAITVLTSMDQDCLTEIGVDHPVAEQADRLARLAQASGIDGVVCSPREAAHMRELLGPDALVVTPGVRPAGADLGDQSRVATPSDAISAGASHIVVGRPITAASDPLAAYEAIVSELVEKVEEGTRRIRGIKYAGSARAFYGITSISCMFLFACLYFMPRSSKVSSCKSRLTGIFPAKRYYRS